MLTLAGCLNKHTQGEKLAQKYCGNCHLTPIPQQLDQATWRESVLPMMGLRLGLLPSASSLAQQSVYFELKQAGQISTQPLITPQEWEQIKDYYLKNAPKILVGTYPKLPINQHFIPINSPLIASTTPTVTCIRWDTHQQHIWLSDNVTHQIYQINAQQQIVATIGMPTPVSDIYLQGDTLWVTSVGSIQPSQQKNGVVMCFVKKQNQWQFVQSSPVLHRPAKSLIFKPKSNAKSQIITAEFGFLTGQLAIWNQDFSEKKILSNLSGALQIETTDFNNDGLLDLVVLFGQGDENLSVFLQQPNGTFQQKILLQFPAVYGSTSFLMQDFDQDGLLDIAYTCGDNADYSPILKPYHGLYIYQQQTSGQFRERFFYPINGAYKVLAGDFDLDKDLDLITISFFADYLHRPQESVVVFEHQNKFNFNPSGIDIAQAGRWIDADLGDIDEDGDLDILLANCSVAQPLKGGLEAHWRNGKHYSILLNQHIK